MPTPNRFSLWIVPEGEVEARFQAVIDRLAREHGGPTFGPHVTLFGSLTSTEEAVVAAARRLAGQIAPFTIHVDGLGIGDTYFQSLFATVRPTPELLAARELARQAFPDAPAGPYLPHLSLLYGTPPRETKEAIVAALRGTLPTSFEARMLVVNQTGPSTADWRCVLRAALAG